jgi:hypothetical protein
VAYKRVLDEVPLHIRGYLLRSFTDKQQLTRTIYDMVKKGRMEGGSGKARAWHSGNLYPFSAQPTHPYPLENCD